jgi:hypothetical protein
VNSSDGVGKDGNGSRIARSEWTETICTVEIPEFRPGAIKQTARKTAGSIPALAADELVAGCAGPLTETSVLVVK